MKIVEALKGYTDLQMHRHVSRGERFKVSDERATELEGLRLVKIVRTIDDKPQDLSTPHKTPEQFHKEETKVEVKPKVVKSKKTSKKSKK